MANCDSNKNINKTFIIEHLGTPTISACTGVYTSKVLACSGDTFIELYSGITINGNTLVNNSLSANTIDASVVLSGGTNILDIVNANDTFVTGGTFNNIDDSLSLLRNDGDSIVITGITDFFTTGGTYNNNTNLITFDRNDQLSAFTVDLSTIDVNDTFVTGATLVNKELVLDRNDSLSAVTVDLSGLTSNTGAGLTYNSTTGKIDLGGVLEFNDSSNPSNNMYFIPSTGANIIRWGADYLGNLPVNEYGVSDYITRFDYVAQQGEHKIFGNSGHPGVHIGYYESQTSTTRIRQYKDVAQITIQNTPGVNSSYTFGESDGPQYWRRDIWQSNGSNAKTETTQSFDKFEWTVYNNTGNTNARGKTFFNIEGERIIAGAAKSDGSEFSIFQFAPTGFTIIDGDFKGVGTVSTFTYLGNLAGTNLTVENGSGDSFFTDATTNKRGIKLKGFGETNTETGVGADYSTLVGTSLIPKKFLIDYIASPSGNTFVTGTTFTNNQLNIALNNGTSVGTTIDNLSGLTVAGDVLVNGNVNIIGSATTINSEQVLIKDNIITLNSNATGSTTPVLDSGFEVLRGSGNTKSILWLEGTDLWSIDDDLSVSGYVSGTTYYGDGSNLTGIDDTFVTGGTYSGSTIILNRNDGNSIDVTGITSDSIYTADGTLTGSRTVDLGSYTLTFDGNTVGTITSEFNGRTAFISNRTSGEANILEVQDNSNNRVFEVRQNNSVHINAQGTGDVVLGNDTLIGTEDISLQGSTLITKKLELSTTTDGFLMPRLTTAQKNAISSPDTNLMVFDTDLGTIERYDGTKWVTQSGTGALGISGVAGDYTYYSDYASAIAAAPAGGTIEQFGDIVETNAVVVDITKNITINMNGYSYTLDNAGTDRAFTINGVSLTDIKIINGTINRINGTGGGTLAVFNNTTTKPTLSLEGTTLYCDLAGSQTLLYVNKRYTVTGGLFKGPGSIFLDTDSTLTNFVYNGGGTVYAWRNRVMVSNGYIFTTTTGTGLYVNDFAEASNVTVKVSGTGLGIDNNGKISNCEAYSSGGVGIYANALGDLDGTFNCYAYSNGSYAIWVARGICYNTVGRSTANSGIFADLRNAPELVNCVGWSSTAAGIYAFSGGNSGKFVNCYGESELNTTDGHGFVMTNGTTKFINCTAKTANAGAFGIKGSSSNAYITNFTGEGMTTLFDGVTNLQVNTTDAFGNKLIG